VGERRIPKLVLLSTCYLSAGHVPLFWRPKDTQRLRNSQPLPTLPAGTRLLNRSTRPSTALPPYTSKPRCPTHCPWPSPPTNRCAAPDSLAFDRPSLQMVWCIQEDDTGDHTAATRLAAAAGVSFARLPDHHGCPDPEFMTVSI